MKNYEHCLKQGRPGDTAMGRYMRYEKYCKEHSIQWYPWSTWMFSEVDSAMDFAEVDDLVKSRKCANLYGVVTGYWRYHSNVAFDTLLVKWPKQSATVTELDDVEVIKLPKEAVDAIIARYEEEEEKQ